MKPFRFNCCRLAPRGYQRLQAPGQAGVRLIGVDVQRTSPSAQRITIDLSQRALAYDPTGEAGLTGRAIGLPLPGVQVGFNRQKRLIVTSPATCTRRFPRTPEGWGRVVLGDKGSFNAAGELVPRSTTGDVIAFVAVATATLLVVAATKGGLRFTPAASARTWVPWRR